MLTEQEALLTARVETDPSSPPSQPFLANPVRAMAQVLLTLLELGTQEALHADHFQQQGLVGMGDMGPNMRAPGKSGYHFNTFQVVLRRFQGELQNSRGTGAELHSLTSVMNEIHETPSVTIILLFHANRFFS